MARQKRPRNAVEENKVGIDIQYSSVWKCMNEQINSPPKYGQQVAF